MRETQGQGLNPVNILCTHLVFEFQVQHNIFVRVSSVGWRINVYWLNLTMIWQDKRLQFRVWNVFSGAVAQTKVSETICFDSVFSTWHYNTPLSGILSEPFVCSYFLFWTLTVINTIFQPNFSFLFCESPWHVSLKLNQHTRELIKAWNT